VSAVFITNALILVLNRLFLHWHQTLCDVALTVFYLLGSVQLSVDTAVHSVWRWSYCINA